MAVGSVEWIAQRLQQEGGPMPMSALEAAVAAESGDAAALEDLHARVLHSPLFLRLADGRVALTGPYLEGATFRLTPTGSEVARGVLSFDGSELALVLQQAGLGADQDVWVRDREEEAPHQMRLARETAHHPTPTWVLPALGPWYARGGFEAGDDVLVHVRELFPPLLVLDRVSRLDRDEGVIARRNARMVEAAIAVLGEEPSGWMALDRLTKTLLGRVDARTGYPPDSFGRCLVQRDNRFTLSADGREVRLSHFHHGETARRYLAGLSAPAEALPVLFEEYPPATAADRDKALGYLEGLWRDTPRPELGGMTPAEAEEAARHIVKFPVERRH